MLPSFVCKVYRPRARALTVAGLLMVLSALLTACPGLPPPEAIDFENDPSILRGAWTGKVEGIAYADVYSLTFSPDGQRLAVAASKGTPYDVTIYDADTLEPSGKLSLGKEEYISAVVFGPGGTLATSGINVSFWDASTGERLRTLTKVKNVEAFSEDLTMGATVEQKVRNTVKVKVWDLATETLLNTFEVTTHAAVDAYKVQVTDVAFSPDGRTLAIADNIYGANENYVGTLGLWNLETGTLEKTFEPRTQSCTHIQAVAFSPDGQSVAFNECFADFSLLDVASGRLLPLSHTIQVARDFAFSPDGTRLVTRRYRDDADAVVLDVWNLDGGLVGTLEDEGGLIAFEGPLSFNADGSRVATNGGGGPVSIWDISSSKRLATLPKLEPFKVSLALEASYIDERNYAVTGTLTTEAGDVYRLEGTTYSGTGHRYIKPAHAAPTPPRFQANAFDADGTLHWTLEATLLHGSTSYTGSIQDMSAQATGFSQYLSMERP